MSEPKLAGWRVLITGGGSGIGLACAARFVADGATVTLMGRDEGRLANAVKSLNAPDGRILTTAGDVAVEDDVRRAVAVASNDGERLDVAIANAGMGGMAPVIRQDLEEFERLMRTNLNGTMLTYKHAGAAIARSGGGAMCAVSSIAGVRTHRFMGAYCASKAGIDMLTQNTADELGVAGVRCNSVCPGLVETDLSQGLQDDPDVLEDYLDCMPIRRTGKVSDIAEAVRFLCGPEASWITGVILSVDGGHHLRRGPNIEKFARALYGEDATLGQA